MKLTGWQARFFGKSSGVMLIRKAIDLKKEATGGEAFQTRFLRHVEDECYPVRPKLS